MSVLISAFIGLLVIVAIITFGPTLGGKLEEAQPALGASSDWNSTYNTDLPSGAEIWEDNVGMGVIAILVFFVALALYYIRSIV